MRKATQTALLTVGLVSVPASSFSNRCFSGSRSYIFSPYGVRQGRRQHLHSSIDGPGRRRFSSTSNHRSKREDNDAENVQGPLALLLFSQFLLFIGVGAVIPSIPLYGKELGFSSAANGIVIAAPAVALVGLAKVGGNLADQARKPALMAGMAVIAVSDFGTAMANGLPSLLVARLGLGAGRCISEAGERGLLADLANQIPSLRGRALAAQQAVTAVGIAVGAPIGGWVVEGYGPRAAFLCVTVAAMLALVLYAFLPETVPQKPEKSSKRILGVPFSQLRDNSSSPSLLATNSNWSEYIQQSKWRGLAWCQSGASFGFACKLASVPILAADLLPGGAIGAGALLSAAGLSGLIGAPMGGWLTDQVGAKTTAAATGTLSALSLLLVPVALAISDERFPFAVEISKTMILQGPALAFSLSILGWSVGAAAQSIALTALAQEQAPAGSEATSMALPRAAGDSTYIVGPFLLGLATDNLVTPGSECALAGTAILLGVLALVVLADD